MIFSYTLDLLLTRRKTQTRRIARPAQTLVRHGEAWAVEMHTDKGPRTLYEVGKTYAVQPGRAKKAVAQIKLMGLREETVQDISEADAIAEGYESREAFFAAWRAIHGAAADMQQRVWVLEFRLLEEKNR